MTHFSDKDYQETKQIMLDKAIIKPEFKSLIKWISDAYGVKPINIYYDTTQEGRPRLELIFKTRKESDFLNKNHSTYTNYDIHKQQRIAQKFEDILQEKNITSYDTHRILIYTSDFIQKAKDEANASIDQKKLEEIQDEYNEIWLIQRLFSGVVFFVYTNKQLKSLKNSKQQKLWTDRYFDLLQQQDIFKYFNKKTFKIALDSKENFDQNYESNWMYYFR